MEKKIKLKDTSKYDMIFFHILKQMRLKNLKSNYLLIKIV